MLGLDGGCLNTAARTTGFYPLGMCHHPTASTVTGMGKGRETRGHVISAAKGWCLCFFCVGLVSHLLPILSLSPKLCVKAEGCIIYWGDTMSAMGL